MWLHGLDPTLDRVEPTRNKIKKKAKTGGGFKLSKTGGLILDT